MTEFNPAFPEGLRSTPGTYTQVGQMPGWITPIIPSGGAAVIVQPIIQQATFILRGFYATSGQYEIWSGPSRNTPNPSGHPLTDITVVGELVGTGTY